MRTLAFLLLVTPVLLAYERLSPFTEVKFESGRPIVRYDGRQYELVELEGVRVDGILEFCRARYGSRWEKRFAEDLVEVLHAMGRRPGRSVSLVLKADGKTVRVEKAPMTEENRNLVWRARNERRRTPTHGRLTAAQVQEDLAGLRAHLAERYSYFRRRPVAWKAPQGAMTVAEFAVEVQRLLAAYGDGHTGVAGLERYLPREYTPFLIGVEGDKLFAFRNRSSFLDPDHPYLRAIDGVPVARWLKAAQSILANGSPQFRLWRGARNLRLLGFLRRELGLPSRPTVRVELEGRAAPLELPVAGRKPIYGPWPLYEPGIRDGIGILRIPGMEPGREALVRESMARFQDTRGLVIDVRGNGGGTRDLLRVLLPYFMRQGDAPRVVNVAKYRLGGEEEDPQGHLDNRFLYPATWTGWTTAERGAIADFARTFRPEWTPPGDEFSAWHYMVIRPGAAAFHYDRPVVVLLDPICFSATDIFLGAFKGWRNVTLMGLPSGGGSGRTQGFRLRHSGLEVRASSMASFQPNGQLYDGNGVEPDVLVAPRATDWLRGSDSVLEAALRRLR